PQNFAEPLFPDSARLSVEGQVLPASGGGVDGHVRLDGRAHQLVGSLRYLPRKVSEGCCKVSKCLGQAGKGIRGFLRIHWCLFLSLTVVLSRDSTIKKKEPEQMCCSSPRA